MKTGLSVIHQPPTFWQPPSRTYTHPPTLPQTSFFPFPSSVGRIQSKSPGNPLFCQQPAPNDSFFFTTLHPILCFYLRIPRFCLSDECTNYLFFFFVYVSVLSIFRIQIRFLRWGSEAFKILSALLIALWGHLLLAKDRKIR